MLRKQQRQACLKWLLDHPPAIRADLRWRVAIQCAEALIRSFAQVMTIWRLLPPELAKIVNCYKKEYNDPYSSCRCKRISFPICACCSKCGRWKRYICSVDYDGDSRNLDFMDYLIPKEVQTTPLQALIISLGRRRAPASQETASIVSSSSSTSSPSSSSVIGT